MSKEEKRAEIIVNGFVQGVGFRYFVYRHALSLGLKGYVKNLFTGEVLTVVEGEYVLILDLIEKIKVGPAYAAVKSFKIEWEKTKNEFTTFGIEH